MLPDPFIEIREDGGRPWITWIMVTEILAIGIVAILIIEGVI